MITLRLGAFLWLATLTPAQDGSTLKSPSFISEPKLPAIDHQACPGQDSRVPEKLVKPDRLYSSWDEKRRLISLLKPGADVIVLEGVNLIRKPDVVLVKAQEIGSPLKPGDKALRYGLQADGNWDVWARGISWQWRDEVVVEKGGPCGFGEFGQGACLAEVIENGVKEWWVQIKTSDGQTGWVFVDTSIVDKRLRNEGGNFADLCSED
jgi:hypothetical protein